MGQQPYSASITAGLFDARPSKLVARTLQWRAVCARFVPVPLVAPHNATGNFRERSRPGPRRTGIRRREATRVHSGCNSRRYLLQCPGKPVFAAHPHHLAHCWRDSILYGPEPELLVFEIAGENACLDANHGLRVQPAHDCRNVEIVYLCKPPCPQPVVTIIAGTMVLGAQRNGRGIRRFLAQAVRPGVRRLDASSRPAHQAGQRANPGQVPVVALRVS